MAANNWTAALLGVAAVVLLALGASTKAVSAGVGFAFVGAAVTRGIDVASEREAQDAARTVHAALGGGDPTTLNRQMITDTLNAAGVQLNEYDRHVIGWLAGQSPAICATIAGIVARAADPGPASPTRQPLADTSLA